MSILSSITRNSALALLLAGGLVGCADASDADLEDNPSDELAATAAPADGLKIVDISTRGTGCPAGSAQGDISGDGQAFTLTFSKYQINLAPADADTRMSLNCDVTVKFATPPGLQYSVTDFAYQGYVNLAKLGQSASVRANYHYEGGRDAVLGNPSRVFNGPTDQSFTYSTPIALADWSPCGTFRDLVINTSVNTTNVVKGAGAINLLAIDAETKKKGSILFKFQKRICR